MKRLFTTAVLAAMFATQSAADDFALVIGNAEYENLAELRERDVERAGEMLSAAGVNVTLRQNADSGDIFETLDAFIASISGRSAREPDSVAVILSGHFARSATDAFLLPTDFPENGGLPDAMEDALPLSAVLAVLADYPGEALLVLGDSMAEQEFGPFLTSGAALPAFPQGVTVLTGAPGDVIAFASRGLPDRAGETVAIGRERHDLNVSGFMRRGDRFFDPADENAASNAAPQEPVIGDDALWQTAQQADTVVAYRAYLEAFPDGAHASDARAMIDQIRNEPFRQNRLAEESLGLSRAARQDIQRDLSILGYDTRGIDGIFGPGTRGAIKGWQAQNAFQETSYLTRDQITRIDAQAERRAAELEAEAEQRRIAEERQDRAFWEETGAKGDEAGLRAYVQRYPDGLFADVAQERLDAIEEQARAQAAARDREAWDAANNQDNPSAYRSYLTEFPQGAFASEARARIEAATESSAQREVRQRAKAQEEALNMNRATRRLVEDRLNKLGLEPGEVDGRFDKATRRALRRFQQARNLTVTGFVDQDTAVRLLTDTLLGR